MALEKKVVHASALGKFAFWDGLLMVHDSPRYAKLSEGELEEMLENHRFEVCRNAARLELAERRLGKWQRGEAV